MLIGQAIGMKVEMILVELGWSGGKGRGGTARVASYAALAKRICCVIYIYIQLYSLFHCGVRGLGLIWALNTKARMSVWTTLDTLVY